MNNTKNIDSTDCTARWSYESNTRITVTVSVCLYLKSALDLTSEGWYKTAANVLTGKMLESTIVFLTMNWTHSNNNKTARDDHFTNTSIQFPSFDNIHSEFKCKWKLMRLNIKIKWNKSNLVHDSVILFNWQLDLPFGFNSKTTVQVKTVFWFGEKLNEFYFQSCLIEFNMNDYSNQNINWPHAFLSDVEEKNSYSTEIEILIYCCVIITIDQLLNNFIQVNITQCVN